MKNLEKYANKSEDSQFKGAQGSGLFDYCVKNKDNHFSWEKIQEAKTVSGLKVMAKGVQCEEDALNAVQNGADALWVTNHGARQLDTVPTTLEMLPEVVRVGKKYNVPVVIDGGLMRGSHVLKAIALGADAIFLGRPILWGLGAEGEKGVEQVLRILN